MRRSWAIALAAVALAGAAGLSLVAPDPAETPTEPAPTGPRTKAPLAALEREAAPPEPVDRARESPPDRPSAAIESPAPETGSLLVRVRSGAAVPWARVRLAGPADETIAGALFPSDVPTWRVELVPPGSWTAWIAAGSAGELGPHPVEIRHGEETILEIDLPPGLALSVRVVDEHGDPIGNLAVSIVAEGAPPIAALETRTDPAGAVLFEGLPAGRHRIWIEGQEWEVDLRSDDSIELRLAEPDGEH
mgnify:CR=1 FL=1